MKSGFKSLSAFGTYSFLSILLGASALLFLVWLGLLLWGIFTGSTLPSWYDLWVELIPVTINPNSSGSTGNYSIGEMIGNISIWNPAMFISILSNLIPPILWGSICYGVYLLRKIIRNVDLDNHFASENVKYMRIIGWMVIIVPHIKILLQNIIIGSIPFKTVINGMEIHRRISGPVQIFSFALVPEVIVIGLLVFVFAEVFKAGKNLKEENDLTV